MANNMQYLCCIIEADVCSSDDDDVQRHVLQTQFAGKYISEGAVDVTAHSAVTTNLWRCSGCAKLEHKTQQKWPLKA